MFSHIKPQPIMLQQKCTVRQNNHLKLANILQVKNNTTSLKNFQPPSVSQVFQLDFLFPAKMVSHLKLAKNVNFEKNVLSIFSKTVKMVFDNFDLSIFSKTVKMVFDKFEKISRATQT